MSSIWFDPGDNTGWARFKENGDLLNFGYTNDIMTFLKIESTQLNNYNIVGIERFSIHPDKALAFIRSEMYTIQVIGMIKYWKYQFQPNAELILQRNTVKSMGYKYGNFKPLPKSNSMNHAFDAIAHGIYGLQVKGIRRPQQANEIRDQN